MSTKVSVVVPVYNPGPYIEPCVTSLLGQSMPADELELIFVDDGSTDDSLARLQALEAEHPQVRVIPIPNSGWPGKPRNVGTDAAQGEYVMFVDQDDAMDREALERMHALASANAADVVLGKVISDFRGVNHDVYRQTRPRCDVFDAPLMESLTPHKMFRTQFLRDTGIRYPEGPRRLEDQLYMAKAYFQAKAATIVGDYVCYRYQRRPDGGNAGSKRFDPAVYYGNLREVLDVVDAHTEPGEERDHFYRRFLRVELLGRLGGGKVLKHPDDYFAALLAEVRTLLEERFPLTVYAGMGAAMRVRAGIVRGGDREQILALAREYNAVKAVSTLLDVRAAGAGFDVDVEVRLTHKGQPLRMEGSGDQLLLPRSVVGRSCSDAERRVDDQVADAYGDVVVRHRELRDEWFLPAPLEVSVDRSSGGAQLVWRGTAHLDPATAAGGAPLREGKQDLYVRVAAFGWSRLHRLGANRRGGITAPNLLVEASGRITQRFDTDPHRNLSVNAGISRDAARKVLAGTTVTSAGRDTATLVAGAHLVDGVDGATLTLVRQDGRRAVWPLVADGDGSRWRAGATGGEALKPGTYSLVLSGVGPVPSATLDTALVVTPFGTTTRAKDSRPTVGERLTHAAARLRRGVPTG